MMKYKITAFALAFVMAIYALAPFSVAEAQSSNPLKNISVTDTTGKLTNATFSVTRFAVKKGQVVAIGTLTGTLNGQQITEQVTMPVTTGNHSCDILNLQLGPLDLNLLGLRIQLSQVNLDITAVQGSGNLLGNLLCEVAKLLDGNGRALGRLVKLLNDILGALG
ncbi:MAG: hypothetical protein H0W58_15915 [Acidobacteria bacterium]|jgi:hypothetical protein|nr:hypothetical protein [Acidobacteriota bacterium]